MPVRTGKPNFKPTKSQRNQVELMVAMGETVTAIAAVLKCTRHTVYDHFADELENGGARKRVEIYGLLHKAAKAGNVTAQKYLDAKTSPLPPLAEKPEPIGKKEALRQEAQTGHVETSWGEVLQ